jgi:hypothetical protein
MLARMNRTYFFRGALWVCIGLLSVFLGGCLSIPVTDDSSLMIEVLPPRQPRDADRVKEIVDTFSRRYGYSPIAGLNRSGEAGDAYVKAFGYTGRIEGIRENKLDKDVPLNGKQLPYLVDFCKGKDGELFFGLSLRSRESVNDPVAKEFVQMIQAKFGTSRTRVAMPIVVSQLSIGD